MPFHQRPDFESTTHVKVTSPAATYTIDIGRNRHDDTRITRQMLPGSQTSRATPDDKSQDVTDGVIGSLGNGGKPILAFGL